MSSRFNLIAQQLLQKDFEQCTIEELEHYAEGHPYLAPAQFLLLRKLKDQGDTSFKLKAQKAALYYHQPIAFEAFLLADEPVFAAPPPQLNVTELQEDIAPADIVPAMPIENLEVTEQEEAAAEAITENEVAEAKGQDEPDANIAHEEPQIKMPPLPQQNTAVPNTDAFTFEPYHTVDYFASQGIKLSQEELPKDKFGKQLMSFTAWLKTMKKLPAAEAAKNMDSQAEQKVEHLAAHSVSNPEVVTETMAEVWMKQGQPQKAAEVYHKLSLLYPSKKVYFAAKLQNLKQ